MKTERLCTTVLMVACLMGGLANAAVEKSPHGAIASQRDLHATAMAGYQERIQTAAAAFERAEYATARDLLAPVLVNPLFDRLEVAQRVGILVLSGVATWESGDVETGRKHLEDAIALDQSNPDTWQTLASAEQFSENRDRASELFAKLLTQWPDRVDQMDTLVVSDLVFEGRKDSPQRLALMQALFDAGYSRNERGASGTWRELALALLARGDVAKAREVVKRIDDPLTLIDLHSDLRFDALKEVSDTMPSVEAAAAADVERFRQRVAQHPRRVDLAADLGTTLLVAGRHDEALAQADAALKAIELADASTLEHADEVIWVMNNRAIALRRLGRVDEAAAQMEKARLLSEGGTTNVSQSLNLGMLYCHLARPRDARRALEELGPMTGYGRMVEASVRQCIALLQSDTRAADEQLAYLVENRDDGPSVVLDALMRTGNAERGAAELIRQLASETSRDSALDFVQSHSTGPALPGTERARATRTAVLARSDVQAAVKAVGRAGSYAIFDITGIE